MYLFLYCGSAVYECLEFIEEYIMDNFKKFNNKWEVGKPTKLFFDPLYCKLSRRRINFCKNHKRIKRNYKIYVKDNINNFLDRKKAIQIMKEYEGEIFVFDIIISVCKKDDFIGSVMVLKNESKSIRTKSEDELKNILKMIPCKPKKKCI